MGYITVFLDISFLSFISSVRRADVPHLLTVDPTPIFYHIKVVAAAEIKYGLSINH